MQLICSGLILPARSAASARNPINCEKPIPAAAELKYLEDRLKTSGGIAKLKRLLAAAVPKEYRAAE